MNASSNRLWSRDFVLTIAVNFFTSMVFYLLMTTMAGYATSRFGATGAMAGLASGSFIVGALIARVPAGKALDLVGRKKLLVGCLVVFVLASLLDGPAGSLWLLLAARTVHGMAFGVASTTVSASVMALIPAARRGEGTGYFLVSTTLSSAVGPFVAIQLIHNWGYGALFAFSIVCSVAALGVALLVRLPELPEPRQDARSWWRLRPSDVLDPQALPVTTMALVAGGAYSGVLTFVNPYAGDIGLVASASFYFVVFAVFVLCARTVVGRIQDTRGDNAAMYPALVSFAAGLGMLAWAPASTAFLASAALVGLGFGSLIPSTQAIAVTEAPDERVGLATSTFFIMLDLGTAAGPLLLGALTTVAGYRGMYATVAVLVLASTVLYHFVHGHKRFVRRLHT